MAVRRDTHGRWRYRKRITLPTGIVVRLSGTPRQNTKTAAEAAERAHIDRALAAPAETKEVPTFEAFVARWLETYPAAAGNRETTIREKKIHIRLHLLPALAPVRLDRIRGELVDRLYAGFRQKLNAEGQPAPLSEKSIRNIGATLRKILVSAHGWGELPAVPALPRVRVPDPPWDFYTVEEAAGLLDGARVGGDEDFALLLFAVDTGVRAGEQRVVRWSDLDFRAGVATIARSLPQNARTIGPTKSGKARKLPLSAGLIAALKAIRHLRGELVFCNLDGRPLTMDQLHERMWAACRRAALRRIKWHELRHTFASHLVMAGIPLRRVQELLGHASMAMTERYAHLAPGGGAQVASALDRRWSENNSGASAIAPLFPAVGAEISGQKIATSGGGET